MSRLLLLVAGQLRTTPIEPPTLRSAMGALHQQFGGHQLHRDDLLVSVWSWLCAAATAQQLIRRESILWQLVGRHSMFC